MDPVSAKYLAIGILGIAIAIVACAVGFVITSALNGIARNPEAEGKISKAMYVGAGLCEAMGLFVLVTIFLLIFVIK